MKGSAFVSERARRGKIFGRHMATRKEDLRGGSRHCYKCRKGFAPDKEEEDAKVWNEGVKVLQSENEDKDAEAPSDNVQRQTEKASSSSLSGEKTCAHCGKGGDLNRCAKCKVTFYCSQSHQAANYAKHKADCQAPKALVNDTAQPTKTRQDEKSCDAPENNEQPPSQPG